jgi:hypothetical protein
MASGTTNITVNVEAPRSYSYIARQPETAERIQEILGLPDDMWSDLQVEFGLDMVGTAKVTLLLRAEQLIALAEVAARDGLDVGALAPDVINPD